MRWMPLEVFTAGEPNPRPPGVAVRRRLRAVPLDARPCRTWLLPSVNESATWQRLEDHRADAVVGYVWIRRSALRWRRVAWTIWTLTLLAGMFGVLVRVSAGSSLVLSPPFVLTENEATQLIDSTGSLLHPITNSRPPM